MNYYKLTLEDLGNLHKQGLILMPQLLFVSDVSKRRKPLTFATESYKFALNKSRTIFVNSINYYGGEHFGEPYHFLAEITHITSNSAFTKFMRQHNIPRRTFTY